MTHALDAIPTLQRACAELAQRNPDFAMEENGIGYNQADGALGLRLAQTPPARWTPAMARGAWVMLRKYRAQLARYGIAFDAIPEPPKVGEDERATRRAAKAATYERKLLAQPDGSIAIVHPYDEQLIADAKALGGRWLERAWRVPLSAATAPGLAAIAQAYNLDVAPELRAQLAPAAAAAAPIARPGALAAAVPRRVGYEADHGFFLEAPYDAELVAATKALAGARWDKAERRWRLPATGAIGGGLPVLAERFGLALEAPAAARCAALVADLAAAERQSAATEGELPAALTAQLGGELMPFQRAGVQYALARQRVLIADEMGLGKTVQALATLLGAQAFPALVVCPASLKRNWQRESRRWLPKRTVGIIEAGSDANAGVIASCDVVVINYDLLVRFKDRLKRRGWKALVADEFHYCKNHKAQRTAVMRELARTIPWRIGLTGTPILSRPQELTTPLQILGRLDDVGGFWGFMGACGLERGKYGLEPIMEPAAARAERLARVNATLRATCMVRRRKADVLKELPAKRRVALPLPIDNRDEYDEAADSFLAWLEEQDAAKAARASRAEQLARYAALRQLAAKGKMAAVLDWLDDFLESGEKLVLFAHHIAVQELLAARLRAKLGAAAVVTVAGADSGAQRDAAVQRFQTDPACRVLVGSLKAAGVGLTLTAASNVAFVELGWTPSDHDQAEDRCHRIGQHDSVSCWYLLAEDTVDEDMMALVEGSKRTTVNAMTDGIVPTGAAGESMLDALLGALRRRRAA